MAEFAEDAAVVEITRPGSSAKVDLKAENKAFKEQLAEMQRSLELIVQNNDQNEEQVAGLQTALAEREQDIAQLRKELWDMEGELDDTEGQLDKAEAHVKQLEQLLEHVQTNRDLDELLKHHALSATGGDHKFHLLLDRVNIDKGLPLDILRAMETEFRGLLGPERAEGTIYDLIIEASQAEMLPKDAIDLAHLIRKQRNLVAHQDLHQNTYVAREILCLFAASLLWPEFPE